jgi:VWFA-related protein
VFYEPQPRRGYRLWTPAVPVRDLYTVQMAQWMEDWSDVAKVAGATAGKSIDRRLCPQVEDVRRAVRVPEYAPPSLLPPPDEAGRAAWAAAVLAAPAPAPPAATLPVRIELAFPEARGQRIVTRLTVTIEDPSRLALASLPTEDPTTARQVHKLEVDGVVEKAGEIFEQFRARYEIKPPAAGMPIALVAERPLRPADDYVVRLRVRDEVSGVAARLETGFVVPATPIAVEVPPVPEETMAELEASLASRSLSGGDSIALAAPRDDVVLGLWRAVAIVGGERIRRVDFLVDGKVQVTRGAPPWEAELRLPALPRETAVRVEGHDSAGVLVSADELVLNQAQGELAVRLLEPPLGKRAAPGETIDVRAELVVPEGRRVERVEFRLGDQVVATRQSPPWTAQITTPSGDVVYVSAVAHLDDGQQAEALRMLRTPANFEAVDVQLVELYTSVLDKNGRPVLDLGEADFSVVEDGRRQKLQRFGRVDDLPLTLGLIIDVSGSMAASLGEARLAAVGFLRNLVGPGDRCFALSFADRPVVRMPRSDDPEAVAAALESLAAEGSTALHDAVVQGLYYFRGTRGQRALVLLSDGDDTSSAIPFRDALEFARRSGVAIYSIGLDLALTGFEARDKLKTLAAETGGRSFFVKQASELEGVYAEIERELRSQFLLAYASDGAGAGFRAVEVRVQRPGLKARTIRGYYP